jgi:hypothetical protein
MKTRIIGVALAAVLSFGAAGVAAAAPIGVGPRLSIELDDSNFAIGVEGRFALVQIASSVRFDLRPFFDYYFIDDEGTGLDITVFGFGADAIFAFSVGNPVVEPYAIGGLQLGYGKVEGFDSETDFGVNLGGGAKFLTTGTVQPFVELRISVGDFDPILLTGGVLFFF